MIFYFKIKNKFNSKIYERTFTVYTYVANNFFLFIMGSYEKSRTGGRLGWFGTSAVYD
jgi:hypothetical protein